jgi:hypothetical protein
MAVVDGRVYACVLIVGSVIQVNVLFLATI